MADLYSEARNLHRISSHAHDSCHSGVGVVMPGD